jgi:predicted permease
METIWRDVRLTLRSLRHSATFTVAVLATLGISIGMATAMFTVYKAVLIDRFPIVAQEQIAIMHTLDRNGTHLDVPYAYLAEIARDSTLFRSVAGVYHVGARPTPFLYGGASIQLGTASASSNFFDLFGMRPAAGRLFRPEDGQPGAPPVIVLSYDAWRRHFGSDPSIVGHALVLPAGNPNAEIVGVAPPGFDYRTGTDAWLPLPLGTTLQVDIVARLAPHVAMETARTGLLALTQRLNPLVFADIRTEYNVSGVAAQSFVDTVVGRSRPVIIALTLAITLLLVIACVNIANLMLVRLLGRSRDMAIRQALGANPGHIARLLAAEATVLVTVGGALAFLGAVAALRLIHATVLAHLLARSDMLDAVSAPLSAAATLSLVAWLVFGALLSVAASRVEAYATLRAGARTGADTRPRQRARRVLVATQVALTVVMLTGAGLLGRTLARLESIDLGYQPSHLSLVWFTSFTGSQGFSTPAQATQTIKDLVARFEATPGVVAATPVESGPFKGEALYVMQLVPADRPALANEGAPGVPFEFVGPAYFRTFRIPIRRGRAFQAADARGAGCTVIVSETLARRFWPNQDPVGKQLIQVGTTGGCTVVGEASDTRYRELRNASPVAYYDWEQITPNTTWLLAVRTTSPLAAMLPGLRAAVHDVKPDLRIWDARTMDDLLGTPLAQPRLSALLMTSFSLVALLLSTIGLYGVISSAVRQQTHDIGVRLALGALARDVRRLVLGDALAVLGVGAAIGIVVALIAGRVLSSQLFGVSPIDPVSLALANTVLLAVGLGAAYLPAYRAGRTDPVEVLRSE